MKFDLYKSLSKFSYVEILLVEAIVFMAAWLVNQYIALLLTLIFVPIFLSILIISAVSELIEPTKISNNYFKILLIVSIVPVLVALTFLFINDWEIPWLN